MQRIVVLVSLTFITGFGYLSVKACMCPGVNPDLYPPDIKKSRDHYKNEFKGAAFTGKVTSSREAPDLLQEGKKLQELTVEIDRFWFGVNRQSIIIYTPKDGTGCWLPFLVNESYFFIPSFEDGRLQVGICAYATYNRKNDGNYVAFMVKMFGKGKKYDSKR